MTKAQIKAWYSKIGKKGGKKTAQKGSEYYRSIGAKGLKNRYKKLGITKLANRNQLAKV